MRSRTNLTAENDSQNREKSTNNDFVLILSPYG